MRLTALFVFIFLISLDFVGQPKFRRISIHDGLSNNIVYKIAKGPNGFMWFGTRTGIDRYDGQEVKQYKLRVEDTPYDIDKSVSCILTEDKDQIWVGTSKGLFYYNVELDVFKTIHGRNKKVLSELQIQALYLSEPGKLLVGTQNSIYLYDYHKDSLSLLDNSNKQIHNFFRLNNGVLLIACSTGIYKLDLVDYSISSYRLETEKFDKDFNLIYRDQQERIWFCSIDNGILIYNERERLFVETNQLISAIPKNYVINKIISLNTMDYGLAVDGLGMIIVDTLLQVKEIYRHNEDNPESISGNGLYDIYKDPENRIWISTYGDGVNIIDPNTLPFKSIKHIINQEESLNNNSGRAVLEDRLGRIWYGTNKGVSIYDPKLNKWQHICNTTKNPAILGNNTVLCLSEISDDEIWVGSYGGGIDRININNLKVTPLFPGEKARDIIGSIYIYDIFKDSDGDIWVGAIRNNALQIKKDKTIISHPTANNLGIYEGANKKIYLGSRSGFQVVNKNTGEIERFSTKDSNQTVTSDVCFCFYEDKNGVVYIGTEGGGLNIYSPKTNKFRYITVEGGLASNIIYDILADKNENLWLGTSKGLTKYFPKTNEIINYDISDGLAIKEFKIGSAYQTSKGEMIFGGNGGFVSFIPEKVNKIIIKPKLVFNDFKISSRSVQIGQASSPLAKHIDLTDELVLQYNENSFSFDFVGINYTNPVKNRYSWKLEGFDKDWSLASESHTAIYTNIPPGDYTFKVRTSNIPDSWNGNEREIKIIIRPPWWQSEWAIFSYIFITSAIVYLVFNYLRIRFHNKQSSEKIQFFINVAHDLKTPLTLIKSPLSSLSSNENISGKEKELIGLAMNNVNKLTSYFTQLLDFQKAEMKKMRLQVDRYNVVNHLGLIASSFQPLIEKKRIGLEVLTKKNEIELWYDRMKFDKIFNNLFSNAIKYTPERKNIKIRLKTSKKYCIIEIGDEGIGIPENQHKSIFKRYYRATNAINSEETGSGVGLLLVKQLVDLHSGKISFTSQINAGTCFTLKFLAGKQHYADTDFISNQTQNSYIPVFQSKKYKKEIEVIPKQQTVVNKENFPVLMIVEDSNELIKFLSSELENDYQVIQANNGKAALDLIAENEPDIIISDIMMPVMDGRVFCSELKQNIETSHIPIILLTALSSSDYKIEGYELGADGYIEKPFELGILKSKLNNLLNSRKKLKEKFLGKESNSDAITYKNKLDQEFIQRSIEIVNQNIDNPELSVEMFSKELFMSRPVVYRKLKALTGQSPQDFIKIIRLKKSAKLIRQGEHNISEVAYMTGFTDPKYFSTSFKKFFGTSPSKYLR